ncbi:MAG: serine/threonine-protein kinase [Polyangia bacterium]
MAVRFGRYELLRRIGRGGMAEVFLARYAGPQGFEKRLVIKRVLPAFSSDRRFLRLFFEEARTHVSLSHGNLVPVFDFGRVGNAYFIAMEEVRGCDLGTLLAAGAKRGRKLPPLLVAHIGIEVCRGLAYVHRRGFVHRDVSPRNVLLSSDGEVKLSDFGVALAAATDPAPGVRGTLAYMAPQQARGERADGRADLFALGMVLAEALVGRRVRAHSDETEALAAARAGKPAVVDGPLGAVIHRATLPDPAERWQDAEAMLVALEQEAAALGRGGATAARELAACVADWVPLAAAAEGARSDEDAAAVTAATVGEETYFRDRESASFVDEVLDGAVAPRVRRAGPWVAAAAALVVAGALVAGRVVQSAHRRASTTTSTNTNTNANTSANPTATSAPPPATPTVRAPPSSGVAVRPTAPSISVAPPSVHRAPVVRKPTGSGALSIHCTPWCIPSIDNQVRGSDGRNHRFVLPAGAHRVSVRRLDDHAERTVEISDGESKTIDFTFD